MLRVFANVLPRDEAFPFASDTGRRRGASGANIVAHKNPLSNSVSIDEWNGRMQASTRGFTCERVEAAILTSAEPLHLIVSLLESRSRIAARASRDFHSSARARRPRCNKIIPPSRREIPRCDLKTAFLPVPVSFSTRLVSPKREERPGSNPSVVLINPLAHDRKWKAERREMDSPLANGYFADREDGRRNCCRGVSGSFMSGKL